MPVADERRADEKPRRLALVGAGGGGLVWFSFRFRRYLIVRLESLFALCPSDPANISLARSLSRALMLGCAPRSFLFSFSLLRYYVAYTAAGFLFAPEEQQPRSIDLAPFLHPPYPSWATCPDPFVAK